MDFSKATMFTTCLFLPTEPGVLAVGSARGPRSLQESIQEGREAALYLHDLLSNGHRTVALDRVKLDEQKCAICLTCYRFCPHRAISIVERRPVFSDLACKVCGICAAECPMDALQIHNFTDEQIKSELKVAAPGLQVKDDGGFVPSIVAFCCKNSAMEAATLAAYRKLELPEGLQLVEMPCAGKIDMDYLLNAFKQGADGVMVMACHPDSCKSMEGSTIAQWRVEEARNYLQETGLEPDRLVFQGLAPAMGKEFSQASREFEKKLIELGESQIRKSLLLKKSA